ncbi:DUF3300 domain-containing protein [Pseudomonas plecoglossicida]|uniref:DUF3300 domain-containing protein n=2 Tax=Pseudomonas plecoglossicida TaxID=70775 RepID=A0AAD0QU16_PSEDL|nr:DUF3300 domain-containing protein [Pseudomonas plecoglossicida]AXM95062.1 DUF3300 domain-containing protein [Pseudomonas plecoglossicida]QLB55811.1 DUF3300 domain-containing protein [Pseudomonas plecoglossicida]
MRKPLLYVVAAVLGLGGVAGYFMARDPATPVAPATTAAPAAAPVAAVAPAPAPAPAAEAPAPKQAVFNQEQLDQMMAPIALYPDSLLAQVLMASTYPGEVTEAVAWSKANPNAQGDDAVKQVAQQTWDPSVQSLVAFPQVVELLGKDPVWVQRMGDAFLAQPDDVMASVQRLRHQAKDAGNLQSNQYQNVSVQVAAPASAPATSGTTGSTSAPASSSSTIVIEPANPQVVYVPSYNPTTTYGTWSYPSSPPAYYPPSPWYTAGTALMAGLAFGTGVAIVNSLWGDCDWDDHDIDVDVNRYNNINANNRIGNNQGKWQHNAVHRDGVPYRDSRSRQQYGRQLDGASQRAAFRGDDPQRAQARDRARTSMDRAGIERPATPNNEARDRARASMDRAGIERPGTANNDARDRARASMDRAGIERPATSNREARDRVREAQAERPRVADRQQDARASRENLQARNQNSQASQRRQGDGQARQKLQERPRSTAGRARNNAFDGVRSPARTTAQANRGRTSQTLAQRPSASRAAGHTISRPSAPARRGGGGGRR